MADKAARYIPTSRLTSASAGCHAPLGTRDEVNRLFDGFFPAAFGRGWFDLDPWRPGVFRVVDDTAAPEVAAGEVENNRH